MAKESTQLFKLYEELSTNISSDDLEMAREFLQEIGLRTDEIADEGIKEAKRIAFLAKANAQQTRDVSLLERASQKLKEAMQRNSEAVGKILLENLTSRQVSFQFRNLEKWSDEQMREVLNDLDLAKLIEELDDLDEL
ncbi:hypothetical protein [Roseivirga thermotolerans]|uniref:hypothetical protein n=1 Tax=Roseivirga thermotolerans TaxID=1758176 RepID=UPI00273E43B8|nr:hypothetical protein [Roseivirga thermotolerans]